MEEHRLWAAKRREDYSTVRCRITVFRRTVCQRTVCRRTVSRRTVSRRTVSRRTVSRRMARLEFYLKIRTTPGWKIELRTVSLHANNICCEDDFFSGIADFETTPRRWVEIFQPLPRPGMRCVRVQHRHRVPCTRYKLSYVTRRRIEK